MLFNNQKAICDNTESFFMYAFEIEAKASWSPLVAGCG